MAGQGFDPNFTFGWPTARIGVMEGDAAVQAVHPPPPRLVLSLRNTRALANPFLRTFKRRSKKLARTMNAAARCSVCRGARTRRRS